MTDDTDEHCESDDDRSWSRESIDIVVPRDAAGEPIRNRRAERRSPVAQSSTGLVSRDFAPRTGGPELVASWPLGPAPSATEPGRADWEIAAAERLTLQRSILQQPYVGGIDYAPLYLNVAGWANVSDPETELSITLEHTVLSGKPFETTFTLTNTDRRPFASPMIECVSESAAAREQYDHLTKVFSGYELSARLEDGAGTGWLDQGTAVQLWSE